MNNLRVGILGPGAIGTYHAREFKLAGCNVAAILSSSNASGILNAKKLKDSFGIEAKSYNDLDTFLNEQKMNAVSICSPPSLHSFQVEKCLARGLHVLCEKPFVLDNFSRNYETAKKLVSLAKRKRVTLTVNTQWASITDIFPKENVESFEMCMEPPALTTIERICEIVPHMNSVLIKLAPMGKIKNLRFYEEKELLTISFDYVGRRKCDVKYLIKQNKKLPRDVSFSVNGKKYIRKILEGYKQTFVCGDESIKIEDPLKISIERFVGAVKGKCSALISPEEILQNVKMQDFIAKKYLSL